MEVYECIYVRIIYIIMREILQTREEKTQLRKLFCSQFSIMIALEPLCVLKMALFNMFGVCDQRKYKWLAS